VALNARIQRALTWTISAGVFGILLWGCSVATGFAIAEKYSWPDTITIWFLRQFAILPFSGFIVVLALPLYMLIFWLWQLVVERHPAVENSRFRVAIGSLVLASPIMTVLAFNFGSDLFSADVLVPIIVSCWGSVWAPRRFVHRLRPQCFASVAA
jgi:hypothetical protein